MPIPASTATAGSIASASLPWERLTASEKRDRTLAVAGELFAREGIGLPMPALAEALGVGVGSIYRQVGRKDDVIAALVIARATILRERFLAAVATAGDPWQALVAATHATVDDCLADAVTQTAWDEAAYASEAVAAARAGATEALAAMVGRARDAGLLAGDATHEDLRILFCSLRELSPVGAPAAHRLAELVLRGMRA